MLQSKKSKLDNLNRKLGTKPPAPQSMGQGYEEVEDNRPLRPKGNAMGGSRLGKMNPNFGGGGSGGGFGASE